MLKATPQDLCMELRAAEDFREKVTQHKKQMVQSYTGPFYLDGITGDETPENFYHEYGSYLYPRLVYNNPRWNSRSRRLGPHQAVAAGIGHAMNRWSVDSQFRKTLANAAPDYLMCHAAFLTTPQETTLHPSYRKLMGLKVPHVPMVTALDTDDFLWDPVARTSEDWRYAGHRFVRDKDDLIAEAEDEDSDWNLDAVKALAEEQTERAREKADALGSIPDRGEIELYELWVPEHWDEDEYDSREDAEAEGFHGLIYTLHRDQTVAEASALKENFLRKPRGFYGPRWGPYTYVGCYPVPGEAARLAPLQAVESHIRAVNAQARAVQRGQEDFKTLEIVTSDDKNAVRKIKNARHHSVLGLAGFDARNVYHAELGGVHPQQLAALQQTKDQLDRNAGLGEAQRGATTSGTTATETAVAANSSALRMDFIIQQWADGVTQVGRTVAWYLYHDDRVILPLGEDAVQEYDLAPGQEVFFQGGEHDSESGATFDDLELEIEPYSMERTDQGLKQHQTLQLFAQLPNILQMIAMAPEGADWAALLDMYGDAFNMPGLGRKIHPDVIAAQMGAQAAPAGSEGPLLRSTVGGPAGAPKGPQSGGQTPMRPPQIGQLGQTPQAAATPT